MADSTLGVHVAVVDRSYEAYFRCFEGVAAWELSVEQEETVLVWGLLGT